MSTEKVAVVTGSNKGIGYAIVKGLCEKYAGTVYLTARDPARGTTAVEKLKQLDLNPQFHQLDITDQASIDTFKTYIEKQHGGIDLLVNNAGISFRHKINATESADEQAEQTLAVNYFALVKVCESLFPILRTNARVVNVSSAFGHLSHVKSSDLRAKLSDANLTIPELSKLMESSLNKESKDSWGTSVYHVSKVGVSALTRIQQRQFDADNRNISVNSVHPGYVDTDLTNHEGEWSIEQGARAPLFLALEAAQSVKGQYVWSDGKVVDWDSAAPPAPY